MDWLFTLRNKSSIYDSKHLLFVKKKEIKQNSICGIDNTPISDTISFVPRKRV